MVSKKKNVKHVNGPSSGAAAHIRCGHASCCVFMMRAVVSRLAVDRPLVLSVVSLRRVSPVAVKNHLVKSFCFGGSARSRPWLNAPSLKICDTSHEWEIINILFAQNKPMAHSKQQQSIVYILNYGSEEKSYAGIIMCT